MVKLLAAGGITLAYIGFMVLFRFGMPFRVASGGHIGLSVGVDQRELDADVRYRAYGWLGFGLVTIGTIMQAVAVFLS